MGYALWGVLIIIALFFIISQIKGKKKTAGKDLTIDKDWLKKSAELYPKDDTVRRYYMHLDKNLTAQGHIIEDQNHNVIYEEKILYATATAPYEVDYINHIIDYTHHHRMGHPVTLTAGFGGENSGFNVNIKSTFDFDGVDIWQYLKQNGYGFNPSIAGAGYTVSVSLNGESIGKLYSSNQGKNFFNETGKITPKLGLPGCYVLECCNKDIDGLILVAIAFARTEISLENFRG